MQVYADQAGFEQLREWLSRRCGITFGPSKANLLRQRMDRVLRRFNLPDLNYLAREL
ncbi:MAG: protein-glutamate O-methyltransferase CheR, partial [Roseovarius sp.]|nr:protein-glutamate O-methyltransferase CheR [Roseovarius sp.]